MLPSGTSNLASGANASNLIGVGTFANDTTAGLILSGDHTLFTGTYQFDSGYTVTFATSALSGTATLLVDNGSYVNFAASGTYAFGNLTDDGNGNGTLDYTGAGTVILNEDGQGILR